MKQVITVTIITIILLFMINCCLDSVSSNKTSDVKKEQNPTITIELVANTSTGYVWQWEVDNPSVFEVEESVEYTGSKNMTGAPSIFRYILHAEETGKAKITFTYLRPWEEDSVLETRIYEVIYKDNGKFVAREL